MYAKLSSYYKKQLKFCPFSYKSGAVTHTTIVSESCLSSEAMNSSVCIHMVKIIEVEKLEYAIIFSINKKTVHYLPIFILFLY